MESFKFVEIKTRISKCLQ